MLQMKNKTSIQCSLSEIKRTCPGGELKIENIRLAARLLEGQLEDPDVGKKIVIEGNSVQSVLNVEEEGTVVNEDASSVKVIDKE